MEGDRGAGTRENKGGRWAGSRRRRGRMWELCEGGRREKNEGHHEQESEQKNTDYLVF